MEKLKLFMVLLCFSFLILLFPASIFPQNNSHVKRSNDSHLLDDNDIARAVKTELMISPGISSDKIIINVEKGIVTLSGKTNNILTKDRVIKIAESVTGVKSVVNNIEVNKSNRSDKAVGNDIRVALANDPATEAYEVNSTINEGIVTLTGTVQSWQEKDLCTRVAESVRGVRNVRNNLQINYNAFRNDYDIKEDVLSRLKWDVYLDQQSLTVKVNNGNVDLYGTVASATEKRWAYRDAWVNGVESVNDDNVKVQWWESSNYEAEKTNRIIRDEDIKTALEYSFSIDPKVISCRINTNVNNGVVTLRGTVTSLEGKYAAEEDARRIRGISKVNDDLRVKTKSNISDSEIRDNVTAAIMRHPYFNNHRINVTVNNGRIYLTGKVNNPFESKIATEISASVKGVTSVRNDLTYQERDVKVKNDSEIKENIEQQLFWNPITNSRQIKVEVRNGVATLTGFVITKLEKTVATTEAYQGGARDVNNKLFVTSVVRLFFNKKNRLNYMAPLLQ
jgi:osmotically-inducible protein OsmY